MGSVHLALCFDRSTIVALGAMGAAVLVIANDFTALSVALPAIEHDLSRRDKYCHNGGIAFAHDHGVGSPGVHDGGHGPSGGPLKTARLQGKSHRVWGSVPFGGSNGLVCLVQAHKYCHNGGMAFADRLRWGRESHLRGFKMPVHAAARWYSWISPPSRSRRLISPPLGGGSAFVESGERSASPR